MTARLGPQLVQVTAERDALLEFARDVVAEHAKLQRMVELTPAEHPAAQSYRQRALLLSNLWRRHSPTFRALRIDL